MLSMYSMCQTFKLPILKDWGLELYALSLGFGFWTWEMCDYGHQNDRFIGWLEMVIIMLCDPYEANVHLFNKS
jgi:hypothetical protein